MKAKLGIVLMALGLVLIAAALGLFLSNTLEQQQAADAVEAVMPRLVEAILDQADTPDTAAEAPKTPEQYTPKQMTVANIDGHGYIGFVGIPALELELPVMADWSYPQLKLSPCRFTGNLYENDLVIMAHNYAHHFGGLKDLRTGDVVTFTDMEGVTVDYSVVAIDVLGPMDVEEMTAGEYDLTLFTCTYGGKSRVTIRCDRS